MLALLSYPAIIEPFVAGTHQAMAWSIAYAAVALMCVTLALSSPTQIDMRAERLSSSAAAAVATSWKIQILWLALAACGSALLLGVTNHIAQDIAPVPFLWVAPLSLYLLSFVLCFEREGWYKRDFFLRLLGVALGGMAYGLDPSFAVLPMRVLIPPLLRWIVGLLHVLPW